jgi:glycogen(starch) synthase
VVAPTRWMLSALGTHYRGLPATQVIPNGRDPARFRPGEKETFVLAAGRLWDQAKNADLLVRIAGRLAWPVAIAGAASFDGAELPSLAGSPARLLGKVPSTELAGLYGRAAVFAAPARYEPFGLTVLEAALCQCALVLADIPSLRELWDGAAIFVAPEDEPFRATLDALLEQPEVTALLATRARRRALEYSATRMVTRYLAAYRGLCAGATSAGRSPLRCVS